MRTRFIGDSKNGSRVSTQMSHIEPTENVKILSGRGMGCVHASAKIVIPPIPNNTMRNMSNPLSLIAYITP